MTISRIYFRIHIVFELFRQINQAVLLGNHENESARSWNDHCDLKRAMEYLHCRFCAFNQEHDAEQRRHKEIQPDERVCQEAKQSLSRTRLYVMIEPEKRPQLFRSFQNFHYSLIEGASERFEFWTASRSRQPKYEERKSRRIRWSTF